MQAVYQIKIWCIPSAYSVYSLFSYNYSIDNKETVNRYWIYSCRRVIFVRSFFPPPLCFIVLVLNIINRWHQTVSNCNIAKMLWVLIHCNLTTVYHFIPLFILISWCWFNKSLWKELTNEHIWKELFSTLNFHFFLSDVNSPYYLLLLYYLKCC